MSSDFFVTYVPDRSERARERRVLPVQRPFDFPIPELGNYYFYLFLNDELSKGVNSRSGRPHQKSGV